MRHIPAWFVACLAAATASASAPTCSTDSKCPEEYPCCYSKHNMPRNSHMF